METRLRITPEGQVTIPTEIREKAGLLPDTDVAFLLEGTTVRLVRADKAPKSGRGAGLVAHLRGRGDVPISTDEVMALTRGR